MRACVRSAGTHGGRRQWRCRTVRCTQVFRGLWRVQAAGEGLCRLSYSLFVRPQPWLLVGLVEARIAAEIGNNLRAVKTYVEGRAAAKAG